MVLNVKISDDEWMVKNLIGENILENRNIFINYLMGFVTPTLTNIDDCDRTYITLPTIVTKAERHSIHKMTSSWLNSYSYNNDNGDRYMIVDLSLRLVRDWITATNFQFPPEPVPVEEIFEVDAQYNNIVIDDKEEEFKVLMKIVLAHYPEEHRKWMATQ
jgi:hypothetical protein